VGGVDCGAGQDRSGRGIACRDGRLEEVAGAEEACEGSGWSVDSLVGQVTKDRLGGDEQGCAPEQADTEKEAQRSRLG
jgi:hypothetical protein